MSDFLNFAEARLLAKRRLPHGLFEFIDRGTEDENALHRNREALDAVRIRPRVLTGAGARTQAVSLFGQTYNAPIIVAPTSMVGFVRYRGEADLARAASKNGILFCAATQATASVEEIAAASTGPIWLQLYLLGEDEQFTRDLLQRAWNVGVRTLVVTVDTPVYPKREYNTRNGFELPFRYSVRNVCDVALHPHWAIGVFARYLVSGQLPVYANYPLECRRMFGRSKRLPLMPDVGWGHMRWLRDLWKGNLVLKGILRPDDAILAGKIGADGIVVSSHGGRNLDSAAAPVEVLAKIVDAVGEQMTVIADGGIQRGSDILKILAIGAKAVMVGRGLLYGTAVGGMSGASRFIEILRGELDTAMAMTGCKHLQELDRSVVELPACESCGGNELVEPEQSPTVGDIKSAQ